MHVYRTTVFSLPCVEVHKHTHALTIFIVCMTLHMVLGMRGHLEVSARALAPHDC